MVSREIAERRWDAMPCGRSSQPGRSICRLTRRRRLEEHKPRRRLEAIGFCRVKCVFTRGQSGGWRPLCRDGAKQVICQSRRRPVLARIRSSAANTIEAELEFSTPSLDKPCALDCAEPTQRATITRGYRAGRPDAER